MIWGKETFKDKIREIEIIDIKERIKKPRGEGHSWRYMEKS